MIYHPYQRTITKNGKKIKAWYFWYYDKNGKQVRKSLGTNGKPCLLKREAMAILEQMEQTNKNPDSSITLNEYCKNFLAPDSDYILRKASKGYVFINKTIEMRQRCLDRFLNIFGSTKIRDLKIRDIDKWILREPYSIGYKNKHITMINDVLEQLYFDELIPNKIQVEQFKQEKVSHKGILYPDEIKMLFPDNYDELIKIWRHGPSRNNSEYETYQFATAIFLILCTGMRGGEVRALKWDQFIRSDAILINAMIDTENKRTNHLKKGSDENKKWRVVVLPVRAVKMLNTLKLMEYNKKTDYVFELNGHFYTHQYMNSHFKRRLEENGIDSKERKISIHSLRFTYNTIMKRRIDNNDLRLMIGHVSEVMTEYYDKAPVIDNLPGLLENKGIIDSIFK